MIEYKIVETELGRIVLGAVGGKLAFCHFAVPSLEAVLERVAADFPGEEIVPFGEQNDAVVCPDAGNVAVGEHVGVLVCPNGVKSAFGEQKGTVVCPDAGNVAVGEHMGALVCPGGVKSAFGEQKGTVVCPEVRNVAVGEHMGALVCPNEVKSTFGEQKGTEVCPDAGNVAVGEHFGALVCPNGVKSAFGEQKGTMVCQDAGNVAIGEHRDAELCPERVSHCLAGEFSLNDLLSGRGSIFKWEDMYVAGTQLQVAVWREMYSLGRRELITYSQLAARCGRPRAVRAIASAVGKNPFSLIIPCHRVLRNEAFGADGKVNASKLGNYHWGKDIKCRILQEEGLI